MDTEERFLPTLLRHGYLWGAKDKDGIRCGLLALEVALRVPSGYGQTNEYTGLKLGVELETVSNGHALDRPGKENTDRGDPGNEH